MVSFPQRPVFILLQPPRRCIILHPLGFVFHTQAVLGLAITGILAEVQTFTHGLQSPLLLKKSTRLGATLSSSDTLQDQENGSGPSKKLLQFTKRHPLGLLHRLNRAAVSLNLLGEPDWQGKTDFLISDPTAEFTTVNWRVMPFWGNFASRPLLVPFH